MNEALRHHTMADGRRIAFRNRTGSGPALVFLPGYMSDMSGSKATALFEWAGEQGRACLLFDYSGCGQSSGDFADGTLTRWCGEAAALIEAETAGPVVLIGSSMGGWLMLLVAERLGARIAGIVGIAAAPDFTDWGRTEAQIARLEAGETILDPNPYGVEPTPMHPGFFKDGQAQLRLGGEVPIDCPVHLLHGQRDDDVPWTIALRLAAVLRSDAVKVTLVKDGDHRLSRPQDVALLLATIADLCEA